MFHVLSHRECSEERVRINSFLVIAGDVELPSADHVPDWDFFTPLVIRVVCEVDLPRCLDDVGLGGDASLSLSVIWHASRSQLRGASAPVLVRDGQNVVELQLEGTDLGGTLALRTALTLASPGERALQDPLSPKRPGSLLWEDERRVRLEGAGSRFPISHVSFKETGLAEGLPAGWVLVFESKDLFDSGVGSMRLYLNTDVDRIQTFIADPEQAPELEPVLRDSVNRQVVLEAVHAEELELSADYPPESLGELLSLAVKRNFPHSSLEEVQAMASNSPGEFEAHIQAQGGFLR